MSSLCRWPPGLQATIPGRPPATATISPGAQGSSSISCPWVSAGLPAVPAARCMLLRAKMWCARATAPRVPVLAPFHCAACCLRLPSHVCLSACLPACLPCLPACLPSPACPPVPAGAGLTKGDKAHSWSHGWGNPFDTFWCCYGTGAGVEQAAGGAVSCRSVGRSCAGRCAGSSVTAGVDSVRLAFQLSPPASALALACRPTCRPYCTRLLCCRRPALQPWRASASLQIPSTSARPPPHPPVLLLALPALAAAAAAAWPLLVPTMTLQLHLRAPAAAAVAAVVVAAVWRGGMCRSCMSTSWSAAACAGGSWALWCIRRRVGVGAGGRAGWRAGGCGRSCRPAGMGVGVCG